jgi:hypothetical protein
MITAEGVSHWRRHEGGPLMFVIELEDGEYISGGSLHNLTSPLLNDAVLYRSASHAKARITSLWKLWDGHFNHPVAKRLIGMSVVPVVILKVPRNG